MIKDPLENYGAEEYINAGKDTVHIVKPNTSVEMAWRIFLTHTGRRTDKAVENFFKGDSYAKFSHGYIEEQRYRRNRRIQEDYEETNQKST